MALTKLNIAQVAGLQTALDSKATLANSALTGIPTAPTASNGTNTTQIATTAFVQAAITGGSGSITLTTVGSSGASTLVGSALNVPTYTLAGLLPTLTSGSVLFSNGTTLAQDNANLFWNDTNNRLGIGTATPSFNLDVAGTARFTGSLTISVSSGILKTSSGVVSAATADADYQTPISLTTTGTSGSATFTSGVLNIPNYTTSTTYSAGAGLTLTGTTFSVNNVLSLARLSNLTTNGLVKTTTANGTLAIATAGTDYQAPISLTTSGTSGAATFSSNVLNIPTYNLSGLGGISASSTDTLTNKNLTSVTNTFPTFNQSTTGNAATATKLQTARTINGVTFDGTTNITITTATTQSNTDNSTNIATTAFVQSVLSSTTIYFGTGTFTGSGTSSSPFILGTGFVGTHGKVTLVSGAASITISGLSTSSTGFTQPGNQSGASSTVRYIATCSTNTITIQAINSSGSVNTSDVSSINYIAYP